MNYDEIEHAAAVIKERTGRQHTVALVLGSGLGEYAATLPNAVEMSYGEIPGIPVPSVHGHGGTLISTRMGNGAALVFAGRVHFYEGWSLEKLVFGVRTAVLSGCRKIILTNASGGCGEGLAAGDLVLMTDHLNLTGQSPLHGANDDRIGPRFPDMTEVYSAALREAGHSAAETAGTSLKEGIYAWFTGPSYETPAEVQMAKRMGADLVGMSTVPEAIAAKHMGADVLGMSLVTNLAAGISPTPLSHDEVTATAAQARGRFTSVVDNLLQRLLA